MSGEIPSIISRQKPPDLDEPQFDAIKDAVINGDQSWRSTINERWAVFWEEKAETVAEVIIANEKMANNPRCDAVSAAQFRALNTGLEAIRDKRLAEAKRCRTGYPFDIFGAEIILRLL